MNQRSASLLAVFFCAAVILAVSLFGYAKYRRGQIEDAAFRRALREAAQQNSAMQAHMPTQLPAHSSSVVAPGPPQPPGGAPVVPAPLGQPGNP